MSESILRYRKLWLGLGWLLVASIWYLSLTPKPPQIDLGIDFFDKISHFTAYAAMTAWFIQLYSTTRTRLFYAAGFVCMGIAIEFLQGLGSDRLFEYADMLANSLGVLSMLLLKDSSLSNVLYQFERHILKND
ncbi:MAG: VanZ family protein [Gammaproteobacteria bacterium]|nr:VanZ family protein [Gammaproteobacteria bacterium]